MKSAGFSPAICTAKLDTMKIPRFFDLCYNKFRSLYFFLVFSLSFTGFKEADI